MAAPSDLRPRALPEARERLFRRWVAGALSPLQEGDPAVKIAALSVTAGVLMAVLVAVITGVVLRRIFRERAAG